MFGRRTGVRVAETAFGVTYDGPALTDGRMPVKDLAPALLALGELFAEASLAVYPTRKPVALNVKATQQGSFEVILILESAWDHIVDLFSSDAVESLLNLKELVIGTGVGLFALMKKLRTRRITHREPLDSGRIRITFDDGTTVEVPAAVLELYGSVEVRKQVRQVVEPLHREGIDLLEFRSDEHVTVSITTDEAPAFDLPTADPTLLSDQQLDLVVSIASVAFVEGNKWRLTDGDRTFHATIGDADFLERVEHGEPFRKGDMLRCRIRIVQSQALDGLHTDYQVVQVLEHIPRTIQLRLGDDA